MDFTLWSAQVNDGSFEVDVIVVILVLEGGRSCLRSFLLPHRSSDPSVRGEWIAIGTNATRSYIFSANIDPLCG
jgi:hypothetical protein